MKVDLDAILKTIDKANAATLAAGLLVGVFGATIANVIAMFKQTGMTDEEINAAITPIVDDFRKRNADARKAAGLE